jgi:hypothetical protein
MDVLVFFQGLRRRPGTYRTGVTISVQDSAVDARVWVESNSVVVEETFQRFLSTCAWPDITGLQRHFDRRGLDVDVQALVDLKPRVRNEVRLVHTEHLTLQLRHLMWIDAARPLVTICTRAIRRAVAVYFSDTDDSLVVTSEDQLVEFPSDANRELRKRAYEILTVEHPSPFAGPESNDEKGRWAIRVDSRTARRFRDVVAVGDFVACQDILRAEAARDAAQMVATHGALTAAFLKGDAIDTSSADLAEEIVAAPMLFLSWGRPTGKRVAAALRAVLELRLPEVEVFFSPTSIEPGADPYRRMFDEGLLRAEALLVVLTEHGAGSPFVIWETAAAWGRGKLVIPVFVNIEPGAVPGPLTTRVQGVQLADRRDLDRALRELAVHFGLSECAALTDEEHANLTGAVLRTGEEPNH